MAQTIHQLKNNAGNANWIRSASIILLVLGAIAGMNWVFMSSFGIVGFFLLFIAPLANALIAGVTRFSVMLTPVIVAITDEPPTWYIAASIFGPFLATLIHLDTAVSMLPNC